VVTNSLVMATTALVLLTGHIVVIIGIVTTTMRYLTNFYRDSHQKELKNDEEEYLDTIS